MIVNTDFIYSTNSGDNNFVHQMQVLHLNIQHDLEQYRNFFQSKVNTLKYIENSIKYVFNNNDTVKEIILYATSQLRDRMNLSINNVIDRNTFLLFNNSYVDTLHRMMVENQLSNVQEQKLNELINFCNAIKNELTNNELDNNYNDDTDNFDTDSDDSNNEEPSYLDLN